MTIIHLRFQLCLLAVAFGISSALAITIPTVTITNPGNSADMRYVDAHHPNGVGAVAYQFQLGQTEVTNSQYVVFLNSVAANDTYGLYNQEMNSSTSGGIVRAGSPGSFTYTVKSSASVPCTGQGCVPSTYTYADKPVVYVSWGDAARFTNWLHNGQPTGPQDASTTEDGAYRLNGAMGNFDFTNITRNAGARWWIPSENEWYKAAYHKNNGVTSDYWDYPTRTDSVPNNNLPQTDNGNSVNFGLPGNSLYPLTNVGAYALSTSPYGTSDQGGNVNEWTDTLVVTADLRSIRGGSWVHDSAHLRGSYWEPGGPTVERSYLGFRVASVPEPTTMCAGALGFVIPLTWLRVRPQCSPFSRRL